MNTFNSQNSII